MLHLDGINVPNGTKVTINGSWISIDGVCVITPKSDRWYDEKHTRVVNAVTELENALKELMM